MSHRQGRNPVSVPRKSSTPPRRERKQAALRHCGQIIRLDRLSRARGTSITKNVFDEQACRGRNVLGAGVECLMEEPAWMAIGPHIPRGNRSPASGARNLTKPSVCSKTGLPDYGATAIEHEPRTFCLELKARKMYLLGYRSLGIFNKNAVKRILRARCHRSGTMSCHRRILAARRIDHLS